eukprot:jgi/Bigna1/83045/fgenesh1_pg.101_\
MCRCASSRLGFIYALPLTSPLSPGASTMDKRNSKKSESEPRIARLGSAEYASMTRSMENLGVFDKFKLEADKPITMIDEIKGNKHRELWKGVKDYRRPNVWRGILKISYEEKDHEAEFGEMIQNLFFKEIPDCVHQEVCVPDFGGILLMNSHDLTQEQEESVSMILCVLQAEHQEITYCPLLPDIVTVLRKYMTPHEAFSAVSGMLQEDFLPTTCRDFRVMTLTSVEIVKKYVRNVYEHGERLGVPLQDTFGVWMARVFTSFLPYECVLRVFDVFLADGVRVLHRVIVAILQMYKSQLLATSRAEEFSSTLARLMRTNTNAGVLMETAHKVKLSKFQIEGIGSKQQHRSDIEVAVPFHRVQVFSVPHFQEHRPSKLVTTAELRRLWMWLPNLLRIEDPVVLYSSDQDGYNLPNLLELVWQKQAHKEPIFVVVRGTRDEPPVGMFVDWSTKKGEVRGNTSGQRANGAGGGEGNRLQRPYTSDDGHSGSSTTTWHSIRKPSVFSVSFASKNKGEEKGEPQAKTGAYCKDTAQRYLVEALQSFEVKALFDSVDVNGSGALEETEAMIFFQRFFQLVFKGSSVSEEVLKKVLRHGSRKLWRLKKTPGPNPVITYDSLIQDPRRGGGGGDDSKGDGDSKNDGDGLSAAKKHENGAWFFADLDKGIGVGIGKDVALQLHSQLKEASTNKTGVSPSLAPHHQSGAFKIYGLEIWGLTI